MPRKRPLSPYMRPDLQQKDKWVVGSGRDYIVYGVGRRGKGGADRAEIVLKRIRDRHADVLQRERDPRTRHFFIDQYRDRELAFWQRLGAVIPVAAHLPELSFKHPDYGHVLAFEYGGPDLNFVHDLRSGVNEGKFIGDHLSALHSGVKAWRELGVALDMQPANFTMLGGKIIYVDQGLNGMAGATGGPAGHHALGKAFGQYLYHLVLDEFLYRGGTALSEKVWNDTKKLLKREVPDSGQRAEIIDTMNETMCLLLPRQLRESLKGKLCELARKYQVGKR